MIFKTENPQGFTLIELLVVVAIISLLSSVVLASLNGARIKARNARRISDMEQLRNAFAISLNDNSSLPATPGGSWVCVSTVCTGDWGGYAANSEIDTFLAPYIKKTTDPSDGNRGLGGYLFISPWPEGPSGNGSYIDWTVEPGGSCAFGVINTVTANFTECLYKVD